MPPSRRKPSNNTSNARAQQTLAFGPTPNKITKASLPTTTNSKKKSHPPTDTDRLQKALSDKLSTTPSAPSEAEEEEEAANAEYPPPPERQLQQQQQEEQAEGAQSPGRQKLAIRAQGENVKKERSEIEEKGARVSEAQIKRYWKGKEDERIAPRVHQGRLSVNEKILRHFDLSTQYGPCIGIPRTKRWQRAQNLGLNPPLEVLAVLLKEDNKSGNNNAKAERAFMEGLLTSRLAVNE